MVKHLPMDVLADVVETVCLRTVMYARLELTAPWGARLGATSGPSFHAVGRGACWFDVDGMDRPIRVGAGEYLLLAKGQGHVARDQRSTKPLPLPQILARHAGADPGFLRYGGAGAATSMVCVNVTLDDQLNRPLFATLPPTIHVKGESRAATDWLGATVQMFSSEVAVPRPGAQAVLKHLVDVLFIQAIRSYLLGPDPPPAGWLNGLIDPQIGPALQLLHIHPERSWQVEELAARVNMSRSAFFRRFGDLVGEPPLKYLAAWRMRKAQRMLHDDHATLKEVGTKLGYASEAAFSRAFKRWAAVSPDTYRKLSPSEDPVASRRARAPRRR